MMAETTWTRITKTEDVPLREGRAVSLGGIEIAIFNLGDRFVAIENQCPHQGGPLCDGIVSGTTVVCPLHGWRFDLDTGCAVRASLPACVTTFPARVEDGIILVDVAAGHRILPEEAAA
ncbi:MAG: nitrite reductase small subunit NirD [Bryobacteraceae bacterium]